ncbi:MAG: hypothetical protein CRN43_04395, partial [Candidatus Nephrothrix sp. EaCA]
IKKDEDHYMGYIVLQETEDPKKSMLIDGQQRIVTISLLILAAVKFLEESGDAPRAEDLRKTYLSSRDLVRQIDIPKIKLNYNNEYIYGGKLMQFDIPANTTGLKSSEKRLLEAYRYFYNQISEKFKEQPTEQVAEFVARKIDVSLFFTSIAVKDDLNAYKVFETLNARGVKLSAADLLKNLLFSVIYVPNAGSISQEEKKWHRINDVLGKTDVTAYLRHFWNARHYPGERKSTLFKAIKNATRQKAEAIRLLNDLDNNVSIYASLSAPQSEWLTNEQSKLIAELNTLDVTQCFSLLMTAKSKWTEQEFNKLLRDVIAISFRHHTIGGQNPNEMERICGRAAVAVFKSEATAARDLFNAHLKEIYIEDDSFKNDFSKKSFNTRQHHGLVKYILAKLEVQAGGTEPELNSKNLTVEHILPENPTEEWAEVFAARDMTPYIGRIGNLTLLEAGKNKEAERKLYEDKLPIYKTSWFRITQRLMEVCWSPKSINERQKELAKQAAAVWRVNY